MIVEARRVSRIMRIAFVLVVCLVGCEVPPPETAMAVRVDASRAEIDAPAAVDPSGLDVGGGRVLAVLPEGDDGFQVHVAFDEVHIWLPALRVDGELRVLDRGSLDLAAYVSALARAGARLERSGPWIVDREGRPVLCASIEDGDGVACRRGPASFVPVQNDAPPSAEQVAALLRAPEWTRPPAARPPNAPADESPEPESAARDAWQPFDSPFAAIWRAEMEVQAITIGAGTHVLLVTDHDRYDNVLCVGEGERHACAAAYVQQLSFVTALGPDTWLLRTEADAGGRGAGSMLTLAHLDGEGRLHIDHLETGGTEGEGEGCEDYEGYCVWFQGEWVDASLLSPSCLELRPGGTWAGRHVRVEDLWDGQSVESAEPCVTRYRLETGRFVEGQCGPTSELPTCAPADP